MAHSPRSLSPPARLASFYFAFFAYSAAYVAYFPLWLAWRGLGAAEIALVLALPQVARIFAPAGWGWLADRTGTQRGIVVFSCVAMAACFALLPLAEGTRQIAALVAISSVLSAGALPLVEAMTLGSLPDGPARYGPIRLWGSVGFIVVLLAGGWWLDLGAIGGLPLALAFLALGALGVAISLPRGAAHAAARLSRLSMPAGAVAVLGAGFCMAIAHGALYAFLTLHLQRQGYSGVVIGVLWTLGVAAEIFVFAFLPALLRRYALSSLMLASFGCAIIRFLSIGWGAAYWWILLVAQLLHAATFGAFHAASVAAVHRIFPAHARGRGQTLFSSIFYGAGGAAGALFAGWAGKRRGRDSPFRWQRSPEWRARILHMPSDDWVFERMASRRRQTAVTTLRTFMRTLILATAASAVVLSGCQSVDTTKSTAVGVDRPQHMLVSSEQINASAEKAYADVLGEAKKQNALDRDAALVQRAKTIVGRLIPQTAAFREDAPKWKWEAHVLTSKEVNAWCMPGGKIAVYTGLVEKVQPTDDELAAILGHEIGHALREHGREQASRAMAQQVALGVIGAVANVPSGALDLAPTVLDVTFNLPHSRTDETEADRIGVELAARAGYDPHAAIGLWEKMQKLGGSQPPQFLSTHPSNESRINDLRAYAEKVTPLYQAAKAGGSSTAGK